MSAVGDVLRQSAGTLRDSERCIRQIAAGLDVEPLQSNVLFRDALIIVAAWFDEHPDAADDVGMLLVLLA